ncbi:MAG: hypothetical protein QOF78_3353 [Phycisphaerales bacterium]|jgi:hypothetical protein|nr:hypothetical protein [Phycisphaerales bacterium]MEA2736537.1 hypothetical protein [Humisphaera sp.]
MSRSKTKLSIPKAARESERQIFMTMEVVSGDETGQLSPDEMATIANHLNFGPYGITPLSGLHFDSEKDTAAS